ncbi:MAG: signal peptidase II [Opitutaceae bacterium]|nr:signal peptidase II [Opitutaceae bacterium]
MARGSQTTTEEATSNRFMPEPEIYLGTKGAVSRWRRVLSYRRLLLIASGLFFLDRLTKVWIMGALPLNQMHEHGAGADIVVIPGFFYLIHIGNTGAAWSMFSGQSTWLGLLALATLYAIFHWRHSLGLRDHGVQLALGLAIGGISGNLVDRLLIGHVVDFIDLHFGHYVYPTFNVADSGICVGIILYLWMAWRRPEIGR